MIYNMFDKIGSRSAIGTDLSALRATVENSGGWVEDETGKVVAGKKPVGTIDLTPTWRGILPMLLALYENGDNTGRQTAIGELQRMADAADAYNKR